MNPSLAPTVAAGALAAYIGVKSAQLYDIYQEWKNLRTGIAMLNPVEYSGYMAVKQLKKGEYGWWYIRVIVSKASGYNWYFYWEYRENYNNNGSMVSGGLYDSFSMTQSRDTIIYYLNNTIQNELPKARDAEGRSIFSAWLSTAYNNMIAGNNFSATYSRQVVAALEPAAPGVSASVLGYRVNVDPASISEDGVNYLGDPDAFYQWFVTNYMNGTNEGTFVTPTNEAYDEIRSQLETIINQLNNLSSGGGVSEEVLNQLKTDILNAINSVNSKVTGLESTLNSIEGDITSVKTSLNSMDGTLTSLSNGVNTLQTDVTGVKTSIDTLSGEIDEIDETLQEGLEQQQGFWDGLMTWLNETLWSKLREFFRELFLPTEEQLQGLMDFDLPEYQDDFVADVSVSSESLSIPISVYGANVNLAGYISEYASVLKGFMNMFVSGLAAFFVIRAFRVYFSID